MSASNWVHIHVDEILRETDKALLCRIDEEELWIPLSQIADPDEYSAGDEDLTLSVSEWFATKNGLEGEE